MWQREWMQVRAREIEKEEELCMEVTQRKANLV